MNSFTRASVVLLLVTLGCSKKTEPTSGAATLTSATPSASSAPEDDEKNPTPVPSGKVEGLIEQGLRREREARKPTPQPADAVIARLQKSGVELRQVEQHIGHTYAAVFCEGAHAGQTIGVSVCEYPSPAAAKAGAAASLKMFPAAKTRNILVRDATTLTTFITTDSPEDQAERKKIETAFMK